MVYRVIRESDIADEQRNGGYSIKRIGLFKVHQPDSIAVIQTTIPAGEKVANHLHSTLEELLYFMTPGRMKIEGRDYDLEKGDLVYLERGTPHEIYADNQEVILLALRLPEDPKDKILINQKV